MSDRAARPLTDRQRRFCAVLTDPNRTRRSSTATAAARAAGYAWPDRQGPRLMQHPAIRAAVLPELARQQEAWLARVRADFRARCDAEIKREVTRQRAEDRAWLAKMRRKGIPVGH